MDMSQHPLTVHNFCAHAVLFISYTVAGMVSDVIPPEEGSTVVSWSPPVPPNGIILYYNVRITRADDGELLVFISELNDTKIDVTSYNFEPRVEYNIQVQ